MTFQLNDSVNKRIILVHTDIIRLKIERKNRKFYSLHFFFFQFM